MRRAVVGMFAAVALSGCYHATVEVAPSSGPVQQGAMSGQVIEKPWAHGFVYGLVPPKPVATGQCANGVAKVETKLSFLNMLAGAVTLSLYTPMSIKVTCR